MTSGSLARRWLAEPDKSPMTSGYHPDLEGISGVWPHPKVRFQKPVTLLQLTADRLGIIHHKSPHNLGPDSPALPHQKNPLTFFGLLASFSSDHPPHKRAVWCWNRSGVEIYSRIIGLWNTHSPTLGLDSQGGIGERELKVPCLRMGPHMPAGPVTQRTNFAMTPVAGGSHYLVTLPD